MNITYSAHKQRNENLDRLADVPKRYIDEKGGLLRESDLEN